MKFTLVVILALSPAVLNANNLDTNATISDLKGCMGSGAITASDLAKCLS